MLLRSPLVLSGTVLWMSLACGGLVPSEEPPLVMPGSMAEAEELCVQGDKAGCLYLSDLFDRDIAARKANPRVFEHYVEAQCGLDVGKACYELGVMRLTGQGGSLGKAEAAEVLRKGCDLGDGDACYTGGIQLRRGDGVGRNSRKALGMLERACELKKTFTTCAEVAQLWSTEELREGPDPEKSKQYYALACEHQPSHPYCGS